MKKVSAVMLAGAMAASLAACGSSETETTAAPTTEAKEPAELSGSISMAGSTSREKFANSLSEAFINK